MEFHNFIKTKVFAYKKETLLPTNIIEILALKIAQ